MNLGIIGLGKIGQLHARIFHSLGVNVTSVISSDIVNANKSSEFLFKKYNFKPQAYDSIESFLNSNIQAVSICSPFLLHYNHIVSCLNKNYFVFVEKPFFWELSNKRNLFNKLEHIKMHKNRKIMVNYNNSKIISGISALPKKNDINYFGFEFSTNGNHNYDYILIDLLPHALSVLTEVLGLNIVSNLNKKVKKNSSILKFNYGKTKVKFLFSQSQDIKKKMIIKVNKNIYKRVQEGMGATYRLYIFDENNNKKYLLEDTMVSSIKKFINFYKNFDLDKKDYFFEAENNFLLMNELINS